VIVCSEVADSFFRNFKIGYASSTAHPQSMNTNLVMVVDFFHMGNNALPVAVIQPSFCSPLLGIPKNAHRNWPRCQDLAACDF
jgi:hypothetical protein